MLILSKSDIRNIFSMQEAITASKEALRIYAQGRSIVPLRLNLSLPDENGQTLFMPAYVEAIKTTGIKVVSVYPNNIKIGKPSLLAQMLLLDSQTGELLAMIDGAYLTQLRTGALQGAATDLLARKNAKKALLIGTGGQAPAQLEAMLTVRDLDEVGVFDIDSDRAAAFVSTMRNEMARFGANIVAVESLSAATNEADIITTITTSKKPVFDGELVTSGTHINAIGAYMPDMQEIPSSAVMKADRIYFDTAEGVLAEAGDIMIPLRDGLLKESDFAGELGELLLHKRQGRQDEEQITLFKAVGTAVLDVVTAQQIYMKAVENGIGQKIILGDK